MLIIKLQSHISLDSFEYQRGTFPLTPWACLSARSITFYHGQRFSPNFKVGADGSRNWIHSLYLVEASSFPGNCLLSLSAFPQRPTLLETLQHRTQHSASDFGRPQKVLRTQPPTQSCSVSLNCCHFPSFKEKETKKRKKRTRCFLFSGSPVPRNTSPELVGKALPISHWWLLFYDFFSQTDRKQSKGSTFYSWFSHLFRITWWEIAD